MPRTNAVRSCFFQEQIFQVIYTSSFYNRSWTQSWSSGWLGDLQTHGWESNSGRIIFLRPWSKGNFSKKEMTEEEGFFRRLYIELYHIFHNYASQWKFEYPFVVQMATGCELHSGEAKEGFVWFAYQGSELLSFQNDSWLPSPKGGTRAQQVCRLFNQYKGVKKITHERLSDACPHFLLGLLDAGKADLQRQVRPEAWLSIGLNPGSDHRMLICHVSGFYPKPIWAMWMRGEQVQQGTQRSDVLPNADETWYLRIYLNVETIETSGLSCRVRHSSLGGQDIILYLDKPTEHLKSMGLIILAVMVLLVLLAGLAFWLRKRWTHCDPPLTLTPLGMRFQLLRDSGHSVVMMSSQLFLYTFVIFCMFILND